MTHRLGRVAMTGAALMALVLALPALAGKERPAPRRERRFDHAGHATVMKARGKGTEGCAGRCHRAETDGDWIQEGKKEHARCFESCHVFETACDKLADGAGKLCVTCHVNLKARCVPPGTARLAGRAPDFAASYSHRKHIAPGAASGQQCEGCHGAFGGGAPKRAGALAVAHRQCAACHERGMEPFMTQCAGCHVAQSALAASGVRPANKHAVTGAFDHQRHAREDRVGTAGNDCLTCHANIAKAATDREVPLPTMRGCYQTCHDGTKAFSATGATCTRCHQGGRR